MTDDLTPDGYRIIRPIEKNDFEDLPVEKGIQCGECGMKFDHNKSYGYACQNSRCPIQMKAY